jgi:hypothetical protein
MGNGLTVASFFYNARKVTPLLYKSNFPTVVITYRTFHIARHYWGGVWTTPVFGKRTENKRGLNRGVDHPCFWEAYRE